MNYKKEYKKLIKKNNKSSEWIGFGILLFNYIIILFMASKFLDVILLARDKIVDNPYIYTELLLTAIIIGIIIYAHMNMMKILEIRSIAKILEKRSKK